MYNRLKKTFFSFSFSKNSVGIFAYKIAVLFLGFLYSAYTARVLQPEGKGKYATIIAISSIIAQFANLGLHSAHTYYISKDRACIGRCEGNIFAICVIYAILGAFLIPFVCITFQSSFSTPFFVMVIFCFFWLNLFKMLQENIFIAANEIRVYNRMVLIGSTSQLAFLLIASFFAFIDLKVVCIVSLFSEIIVCIYSIIQFKGRIGCSIKIEKSFFFNILPYGLKSYAACLFAYLLMRTDVVMLEYFCTATEVGFYSVATNLSEMFFLVSSSVSLLFFPELSRITVFKKKVEFLKNVNGVMSCISILILAGMFFVAPLGIRILYGLQYISTVSLFRLLLPSVFFWAMGGYFYNFLASENYLVPTIIVPLFAFVVNVAINFILIPIRGAIGAAIATNIAYGISYVLIVIITISYVRSKMKKKG